MLLQIWGYVEIHPCCCSTCLETQFNVLLMSSVLDPLSQTLCWSDSMPSAWTRMETTGTWWSDCSTPDCQVWTLCTLFTTSVTNHGWWVKSKGKNNSAVSDSVRRRWCFGSGCHQPKAVVFDMEMTLNNQLFLQNRWCPDLQWLIVNICVVYTGDAWDMSPLISGLTNFMMPSSIVLG